MIDLRLHSLSLTGTIPNSISTVLNLEILDVSNNQIEQDFCMFSFSSSSNINNLFSSNYAKSASCSQSDHP